MPSPGTRNDRTQCIALTFRPRDGVTKADEINLRKWLDKMATQWEIYEEYVDEDPTSRHFHGRILLKNVERMDKIKLKLVTAMGKVLSEKKVLQNGIKWLYDDWEYAGKDGQLWDKQITDEDEWIPAYADPDNKWERPKNPQIKHWLSLIEDKLPPGKVEIEDVEKLLKPFFANDTLDLPAKPARIQKFEKLAYYINANREAEEDYED